MYVHCKPSSGIDLQCNSVFDHKPWFSLVQEISKLSWNTHTCFIELLYLDSSIGSIQMLVVLDVINKLTFKEIEHCLSF